MKWTLAHIKELLKQGKILNFKEVNPKKTREPHPATIGGRRVARFWPTGNIPKDWISLYLLERCQQASIVLLEEYRFHETRQWRFDWVPDEDHKLAIEYEGLLGYGRKTGHTDSQGYTDNTDKYNTAAVMGWTVIRVTYLNYETLPAKIDEFYKMQINGKKPTS